MMFPPGNKTVKVTNYSITQAWGDKPLSGLVSECSANLTLRLHNSPNLPQTLRNEMSKFP